MKVKLGLIQSSCSPDPKANLAKAVERIKKLANEGAQVICLSELFQSLYFCQTENDEHFKLAETIPGETTEILSNLAKDKSVAIVASLYENLGEDYFNTAVVLDADGKLLGKYRKTHIPDDLKNYYGEAFYFKEGDLGYPVFETKYGRVGVLVCWDQWFPEAARQMAMNGAEIIFYPTAIGYQCRGRSPCLPDKNGRPQGAAPTEQDQKELEAWKTIQRSHAIANGVYVASVNRVGLEDNLNFWGSSFVAGPLGEVLNCANDKEEALIKVTCDLNQINEVRNDWPFLEWTKNHKN